MLSSQQIFDKLAPYYRTYSLKKKRYLHSIDNIIVDLAPKGASLLDVGCGDGARGVSIAKAINSKKALMLDNCKEMLSLCKKEKNIKVKLADMITGEGVDFSTKFDLIICLWNVMGHVYSHKERILFLRNLHKLSHKKSMVFIDVSNRYNASYYGLNTVIKNLFLDMLPFPRKNDYSYKMTIAKNKKIEVASHFFSPFEMRQMLRSVGFKISKELYIDYRTGKKQPFFFLGQLLYCLEPL